MNPNRRRVLLKILRCALHGLWMLVLSWIWMGLNLNLEVEANLVKWTSIIKRHTLLSSVYSDSISLQDYTFIDVSGAKKLVSREYEQGNDVITDRGLLDSLFKIVKKYPDEHTYIICDIFFESPTTDDSALSSTLVSIPRIVFPYQYVNDQAVLPIIPDIPSAYSGYNSSSGIGLSNAFLKFNLIEGDTMITLPLKMYTELTQRKLSKKLGLVWLEGRPAWNTSILDIRVQTADLIDAQGFSKIIPLGEVLALKNDSLVAAMFFKNKIVVIGDFQQDLHESIYDKMPGALIIVNMFESLRHEDVYVRWGLLIYLLASYTMLSYMIFYYRGGSIEERIKKFSYPLIGSVGSQLIGFSFALYTISIIAYFVYGIHLDILVMATYLSAISIIKKKWNERKR